MPELDLLCFLKANLELPPVFTARDDYLLSLINTAKEMIAREGITLADTPEDSSLVVMYAAYLYRKRAESQPVMPRMLRWALNNRLFSEKAKEDDDV